MSTSGSDTNAFTSTINGAAVGIGNSDSVRGSTSYQGAVKFGQSGGCISGLCGPNAFSKKVIGS